MFEERPTFTTADDVFAYIEGFTNLERGSYRPRQYRLERMTRLLSMFGNPHEGFDIIHVAGSKGKGSTATFLASILDAAGYATGLYLSPHVIDYRERITQAGRFIPDEVILGEAPRISAYVDRLTSSGLPREELPTTFELLTLLAFLCFRTLSFRWIVVEVGIGGRLDATNVVSPRASVITPIELEHTEYLGNTIEEIAAEKAGIIKEGIPTFVGRLVPAALEVVTTVARGRDSAVYELSVEAPSISAMVSPSGTAATLKWRTGSEMALNLSLIGRAQVDNAALAALVCATIFPDLSPATIVGGLAQARLPGRMEVVDGPHPVVLDGAHTPDSVRVCLEAFTEAFGGRGVLVFGSVVGKKVEAMAKILAPAFDRIIVTTPGTFKESRPSEVADVFRRLNPSTELVLDPGDALNVAYAAGNAPILVTGSFYLVGAIRSRLA